MTAGSMASFRQGSPAKPVAGGNTRGAITLFVASVAVLIFGLFLGPLVWIAIVLFLIGCALSLYTLFAGVEGFSRQGPCPHCETEIKVDTEGPRSTISCPCCKHRITLKNERLVDVS